MPVYIRQYHEREREEHANAVLASMLFVVMVALVAVVFSVHSTATTPSTTQEVTTSGFSVPTTADMAWLRAKAETSGGRAEIRQKAKVLGVSEEELRALAKEYGYGK